MKVLISADMEGISGVVAPEHTSQGHAEYARFRKLMTAEVNAAIEGALGGGADEIIVNDSHGSMTNILIEELNPAAELISGSAKPFGMMQGIAPDIDVVFFVGYHAASGTAEGVLEHTWSGRNLFSLYLNDIQLGETGLNAALAGAHGVPVVLVTGDQAVVGEATSLLGEIETVQVKQGITRTAARCLHPQVAHERIRAAAQRAMSRTVEPFVLQEPVTLRVTFPRALHAAMAELLPGSSRVDGRSVEWTGDEMPDVYKAFRAMMILAAKA